MNANKLVFVYPGDLNTRTGGYRYDKRLIEALQLVQTQRAPWQVDLISLEGNYPFPDTEQLAEAALQLARIENDSLVVVDGLAYSAMVDDIAKHANRLRLLALIHHPLALETGLSNEQMQSLYAQETRALQYARHVITTSQTTADSLSDYHVPAHRVSAILPGTDSAPLANGSDSDTINLLCVATLTQRKAHNVLLDALALIEQLPWQLHCVGSTERDSTTYQLIESKRTQLGLQNRVIFHGELDDSALVQQYRQADVFVLASYHEGYGMVLSEAIAYGLPIVCTNAGAMPQTVPDGAGLLVPPGDVQSLADVLRVIITDPARRAELQQAARKARLQQRTWQQAADEFAALLTLMRQ